MKRSFEYLQDPGHGWIKVDFATLEQLGLKLSDFSSCSYLFYNTTQCEIRPVIFLEEDCDATLFLKAYREKTGKEARTRVRYTERARLRIDWNYLPNDGKHHSFIKQNRGVVA